ncbi:hypothetical protein [Kitasatospora sp. NPDC101183]|uniref:hypothetical protein n=1 Tax=Kitasatospora sp. NPDC101183 TaxID=3364100 RepID=UPI00381ED613
MTINDAVPAPPGTALTPCPSCGLTDHVRGVPAVHLAERRTVTVRARGERGRSGHTETREEVSALGKALAPAPPKASALVPVFSLLGFAALVAAVVMFVVGLNQRKNADSAKLDMSPPAWATKGPSWPFPDHLPDAPAPHVTHVAERQDGFDPLPLSFLVLGVAIALVTTAVLLYRSRSRLLRAGQPQAERLWRQAWYCDRCGSVHFSPAAGQGAGALDLQTFRMAVWSAGGYGELADRYRV